MLQRALLIKKEGLRSSVTLLEFVIDNILFYLYERKNHALHIFLFLKIRLNPLHRVYRYIINSHFPM